MQGQVSPFCLVTSGSALHALYPCGLSPCRDGASNVHFLGIDVSMEALHMAQSNLMQECPQLSSQSIEMVCADYLEGLKQARSRYAALSAVHLNPQF